MVGNISVILASRDVTLLLFLRLFLSTELEHTPSTATFTNRLYFKIMGKTPKSSILIGLEPLETIHFGGKIPLFLGYPGDWDIRVWHKSHFLGASHDDLPRPIENTKFYGGE